MKKNFFIYGPDCHTDILVHLKKIATAPKKFHRTLVPMLLWFLTHPVCCAVSLTPIDTSGARKFTQRSGLAIACNLNLHSGLD